MIYTTLDTSEGAAEARALLGLQRARTPEELALALEAAARAVRQGLALRISGSSSTEESGPKTKA